MYGTSAMRTPGHLSLEDPPPSPADRIRPPMTEPGDETLSLLGAQNANGTPGVSANTPTGIVLGGVMQMMEGANAILSVVPGAIPPQILQLIEQLSLTLPEIVRNMQQQMTGPGGMLSMMGSAPMAGAPPSPSPMMGGEGMGAQPPMMGM